MMGWVIRRPVLITHASTGGSPQRNRRADLGAGSADLQLFSGETKS